MTKKSLKHRPVIETKGSPDISEKPAMQELARLYDSMTDEEKARTIDYLKQCEEEEDQPMNTELLTPKEAAAFLKVSTVTLAKWRWKKTGPGYTRTGRMIRYNRKVLEDYLEKNVVTHEGAAV